MNTILNFFVSLYFYRNKMILSFFKQIQYWLPRHIQSENQIYSFYKHAHVFIIPIFALVFKFIVIYFSLALYPIFFIYLFLLFWLLIDTNYSARMYQIVNYVMNLMIVQRVFASWLCFMDFLAKFGFSFGTVFFSIICFSLLLAFLVVFIENELVCFLLSSLNFIIISNFKIQMNLIGPAQIAKLNDFSWESILHHLNVSSFCELVVGSDISYLPLNVSDPMTADSTHTSNYLHLLALSNKLPNFKKTQFGFMLILKARMTGTPLNEEMVKAALNLKELSGRIDVVGTNSTKGYLLFSSALLVSTAFLYYNFEQNQLKINEMGNAKEIKLAEMNSQVQLAEINSRVKLRELESQIAQNHVQVAKYELDKTTLEVQKELIRANPQIAVHRGVTLPSSPNDSFKDNMSSEQIVAKVLKVPPSELSSK